ncbi:hypothetical protein CYMTET_22519 [Cymbomonas tetramitiformis]|uniref:EF-hand domain-containing protein n=1 Tax=Cymbomonas tetramitiformis TaxID=36881 RepID=A0AAE0L1U3_9CHLO|nr:hypothetical protein CYMTET_22519 [Cymbomonas tetramitiformis]
MMYGCDEYGYLAECTAPHVLNSTIPEDLDWPCPENCFTNCCIKPIAAYYSSLFYHFGLVVTVGFVGLSLFVGVLTTAMDECTAEWRSDEKFERKFRLNNCDQALDDAQIHHIKATITGIDERRFFMERAEMPEWTKKYIKHPMLQMYFKAYLLSTVKIDYFVEQNAIFNHSVTVAIIIGGILVGVNTDESLAGASWLVALDNLIMIVFIVELLLKIYGKGLKPWTYFDNLWNCYDFLVVVAAMIPPEAMGSTSAGANPATCLRLFRLVRILRVIRKLKRLQVIIQGMVHGLGSMALLPVLLIIVYYIFAVVGIWAFRKNDPWHFTGIGTAIVTLFRCSTFEDWTDVMYINQYGCDAYPHDSLTPGEGYASATGGAECKEPYAYPYSSVSYFVLMVVATNFVLLSLFIGVVTTGMAEANATFEHSNELWRKCSVIIEIFQLSNEVANGYNSVFSIIDDEECHSIFTQEFLCMLQEVFNYDITEAELGEQMAYIDNDNDGTITFVEFLMVVCALEGFEISTVSLSLSEKDMEQVLISETTARAKHIMELKEFIKSIKNLQKWKNKLMAENKIRIDTNNEFQSSKNNTLLVNFAEEVVDHPEAKIVTIAADRAGDEEDSEADESEFKVYPDEMPEEKVHPLPQDLLPDSSSDQPDPPPGPLGSPMKEGVDAGSTRAPARIEDTADPEEGGGGISHREREQVYSVDKGESIFISDNIDAAEGGDYNGALENDSKVEEAAEVAKNVSTKKLTFEDIPAPKPNDEFRRKLEEAKRQMNDDQ